METFAGGADRGIRRNFMVKLFQSELPVAFGLKFLLSGEAGIPHAKMGIRDVALDLFVYARHGRELVG